MKLEKRLEHFLKYVDEHTYWKEDNDVPNHVIVRAYMQKFKPTETNTVLAVSGLDESFLQGRLNGYIYKRNGYKEDSIYYGCYDLLVREFTLLLQMYQAACADTKGGENG